ncbi:asparagine synthase (glutamine-hydrolyzing) [uncultured Nitrospira sp.]|uniref:asparagine synthase (glutamine-hydrolyzing) n=1 Tax=uncultured Nitrospira sp. TaxID=157176 RepID=UPI0031409607
MCAICGVVRMRDGEPVEQSLLVQMRDSMVHRGPDSAGIFLNKHVGFGHRRLKIIDLHAGAQPMFNEDGSIAVVYNGEIYNFLELREHLMAKGHTFQTKCDTEVIVHAYEEYGIDCPKWFDGMFAFALYDGNKNSVFLARDRVGIKPLYYYVDQHQFLFASEVRAILKVLEFRPSANMAALDFYVSVGYVPGQSTLFQGIQKLLPGYGLSLQDGQVTISQYWDLNDAPPSELSFDEAQGQYAELLQKSIKMSLMSDVPLGAFLSGGIDSSAVVAGMSQFMTEPVQTFSVGYRDDRDASELPYAQRIANTFHTDHHEYILESDEFFTSLDLLLEYTEEPIVESAAIALFHLSRLAKEHVTVILSGEGSDEILAGYPLYPIMARLDRIHRVFGYLPSWMLECLSASIKANEKYTKYVDWMRMPLIKRYRGISSDVTPSIKQRMYQPAFASRLGNDSDVFFEKLFGTLSQSSALRKMGYLDIKSWLPDDLLVKADKMTMANSLELRVPFLDHHLLEFAMSLPDEYRLKGWEGKLALKKVMEKFLPHEIIYRKKKGFPVPVAKWFRENLYHQVRDVLLDSKSLTRNYFQESYIDNALKRHRQGKEDLSRRLFSLVALEMWHKKYID